MTSTITDTDVKTIETTAFLDAFRALAAGRGWCDDAEANLEQYLGVETRIRADRCSCGDVDCGIRPSRQTEPRFSYVSGPKTLNVDGLKATLRKAASGPLNVDDAVWLADRLGITDLYPPQPKYVVTFTVSPEIGVSWEGEDGGPTDYEIRNALRYGRTSNKTVTKVIEGETV